MENREPEIIPKKLFKMLASPGTQLNRNNFCWKILTIGLASNTNDRIDLTKRASMS